MKEHFGVIPRLNTVDGSDGQLKCKLRRSRSGQRRQNDENKGSSHYRHDMVRVTWADFTGQDFLSGSSEPVF
ncbi:MAG: hypothetical protein HY236_15755 [Acidobacteria bacterium]|nr:hypothetical protein [Acidobacteriota bacterium]